MYAHEGWVAVGVDGSKASDAAVRYAVSEARRLRSGVQLVHVAPDYLPAARPYAMTVSDLAPMARQILKSSAEVATAEWDGVQTQATLLVGRRAQALRDAARDAPELILGHDPRPDLLRLATGSTVLAVVAHAEMPVIVVGPHTAPGGNGYIAVGVKSTRPVVYGLLRRAFEVASDRRCALVVVHAWEMPPGYEGLVSTTAEEDQMNKQETAALEEMVDSLTARHPGVGHTIEVVHGNPARVLHETSKSADLLILARRRRVLPRGHVGGTARAMLHHSVCPLMFVPAPDEAVHLSTEPR
jgi:nucleotide-binding universal stress UspA family protein